MIVDTAATWFNLGGVLVGIGVMLGVWRACLPYDTPLFLLGILAIGAAVARLLPAFMPLMLMVLVAYAFLCLKMAVDLLREERAVMTRFRR